MISPKVSSRSNSRVLFLMQNKTYGKQSVTKVLDDVCSFFAMTDDNDFIFLPSQRILLSIGHERLY